MRVTLRSLLYAAILSTLVLTLTAISRADCAAPSSPGVRICSPTPNATVAYLPALDFNSTPKDGATVLKFSVYDNNKKVFEGDPGQSGATLFEAKLFNGLHNIAINMWDSSGAVYQGRVTFRVVGDGFVTPCPAPSTPGVNFCVPPSNAILGPNYTVSATATGKTRITAIRLYVDGKAVITANSKQLTTTAEVGTQGNHSVTFVAWDSSGNAFKSARTIKSTYQYSFVDCPPRGTDPCTVPGFDPVISPAPNSHVDKPFRLQANIRNNPKPITAMKAYIDNTLAATSNGPIMDFPVDNAPNGTHIITFQAWDTAGILYRIQYNINVNVAQ